MLKIKDGIKLLLLTFSVQHLWDVQVALGDVEGEVQVLEGIVLKKRVENIRYKTGSHFTKV